MRTVEESGTARPVEAARSVLVGRDAELVRLEQAMAEAAAGRPQVVLVDGPGGIGKTALLRAFVDGGAAQGTVIWAAGDASERTVTFGLVDQLARRASAEGRSVPVLAEDPGQYTTVGLTLLEAVGRLQREGPVVLIVDDAQWVDPSSLRALLFATRRLVADTVLVVFAARTEDLHALPDGLLRLAEPPQGLRITLSSLPLGATRELAHAFGLAMSNHALARLHESAAGVPLHLRALLDQWDGGLEAIAAPASYAALVVGRLSSCSEGAQRLVEAAAVLDGATLEALARMTGVHTPLDALEEAVTVDLVRVHQRTVEFVHPLIASAVRDALGPARRSELHAAAAALSADPVAALVHRAHAAAGPDEPLAAELDAAAAQLVADGNYLRAADLAAEAAALSAGRDARERRLVGAAMALCDAGDLIAARSLASELERFAPSPARDWALGRIAFSDLDVAAAERAFEAAWAAADGEDRALRMRIATELAFCAYFRMDAERKLQWAQRAAATAPSPAVPGALALALALNGRLQEGLDLTSRTATRRLPQTIRGRLRLVDDDLAGAREALKPTAGRGSARAVAMALGRLSHVEYLAGSWELAVSYAEQGLATCVDRIDTAQITALRYSAVLVLAAQGAWSEAEQHLLAMAIESADVPLPTVYTAVAGGRLAAAKGDPEAVLAALAPVLALQPRAAVDEPGFWVWQDLQADALVAVGRLEDAEAFLRPHEALAAARGRRSMVARLARSRAGLLAARGEHEPATEAFVQASALFAAVGMPYELALTELAHGRFLRRRRQRRATVEVLANARERLALVGAAPALQQCERELEASGLAPKRPDGKGVDRLTPQELTVARLVLDGMTNREIAGELMVSTKTIEVHLTSVYGKLEVASRNELRARARRGELDRLSTPAAG